MAKRRVPKEVIDDHLLILGELSRQGHLLIHKNKPVQPQAALIATKGGDSGEKGHDSGKFSGDGNYTNL